MYLQKIIWYSKAGRAESVDLQFMPIIMLIHFVVGRYSHGPFDYGPFGHSHTPPDG